MDCWDRPLLHGLALQWCCVARNGQGVKYSFVQKYIRGRYHCNGGPDMDLK
jgi:hypothetical protein